MAFVRRVHRLRIEASQRRARAEMQPQELSAWMEYLSGATNGWYISRVQCLIEGVSIGVAGLYELGMAAEILQPRDSGSIYENMVGCKYLVEFQIRLLIADLPQKQGSIGDDVPGLPDGRVRHAVSQGSSSVISSLSADLGVVEGQNVSSFLQELASHVDQGSVESGMECSPKSMDRRRHLYITRPLVVRDSLDIGTKEFAAKGSSPSVGLPDTARPGMRTEDTVGLYRDRCGDCHAEIKYPV